MMKPFTLQLNTELTKLKIGQLIKLIIMVNHKDGICVCVCVRSWMHW